MGWSDSRSGLSAQHRNPLSLRKNIGGVSATSYGMQMVFRPISSGNPAADVYIARRRVNDAFMRDLLALWQEKGPQVLERVAREQPGTLVKCLTMIIPKEMKIEHGNHAGRLSDDALAMMIAELEKRIASRLQGENAKVIDVQAEPALPPPDQPACGSWKRNPKSSPQRLAKAREYMRKRRAAEKAAKQPETQKTDTAPSTPPA
jgi:hypothetical protein